MSKRIHSKENTKENTSSLDLWIFFVIHTIWNFFQWDFFISMIFHINFYFINLLKDDGMNPLILKRMAYLLNIFINKQTRFQLWILILFVN